MNKTGMLDQLPFFKDYKSAMESSWDRKGGADDFLMLEPGERRTLADIEGPGCVSRIWMTISSADPYIYRKMILRAYWDGEDEPSIECPIGDFFGSGFCKFTHYDAVPLGMTSGGLYCYFPMPFAKSARFEVDVQSKKRNHTFYYAIQYHKFKEMPEDIGYFHAKWNRETTRENKNYVILDAKGKGHYAGCFLHMQGAPKVTPAVWLWFWFLEGSEMIYVDGEDHPPAIYGTGTEDYFNSGWYFDKGTYSAPYHGLTVKDWLRARISAYRFHIPDPVPFESDIRVTIEHGGSNDVPGSDYASTAYWYQTEPHTPWAPLPPASERLPKDDLGRRVRMRAKGHILEAGHDVFKMLKSIKESRE